MDAGIPFVARQDITEVEHDAWAEYESTVEAIDLESEIDSFFGNL
jgi:hypothetical protein